MTNIYKKCHKNNNFLASYNSKSSFKISLSKLDNLTSINTEDSIVSEFPLGLIVNGKYDNTFLCSPFNLKELVVGYLCSRNLINNKNDILSLNIDEETRLAKVEIKEVSLYDCEDLIYLNDYDFVEAPPIKNDSVTIQASEIYKTMDLNLDLSQLFKNTAGAHCISIYGNGEIVVSCEDVARHNAMDKSIGYCLLNDIPLNDKIVFVSGRLSFEMIKKAARVKIPIVIAKSATTSLVLETANKLNITLVGFVRGKKMNIYTNPHRIILE
ncbi:MAG: formate dehydrogenase accessory sulfurtransferase FdhD [Terrisporobacter sp.]